jgi:hypothetical protein
MNEDQFKRVNSMGMGEMGAMQFKILSGILALVVIAILAIVIVCGGFLTLH